MNREKVYFDNLDALRCFAALGVVAAHTAGWLYWPPGETSKWLRLIITLDGSSGRAGVNFFFVLSGFLITYLMFEERDTTGSFSVPKFYLRRVLRIWPLYFLTLAIGFVIFPRLLPIPEETADWKMYAAFLANFDNIYAGLPKNGILGVQWSVAIEEQFYLAWPLIFWFFGFRRRFVWICVILIAVSFWFHVQKVSQFHTMIAMTQLGLGSMMAYFAFYYLEYVRRFFRRVSKTGTFLVYFIGFSLLISDYQVTKHFPDYGSFNDIAQSFFFGFVIMEQNYSLNSFCKFGSMKLLRWLGRISYGLYLLHMVAIYIVLYLNTRYPMHIIANLVLTLAFTTGLAAFSFYFFERPFLTIKERFKGKPARDVSIPST